jgi:hypothetical protein
MGRLLWQSDEEEFKRSGGQSAEKKKKMARDTIRKDLARA